MSAYCEDDTNWDEYFRGSSGSTNQDSLSLRVLEWYEYANLAPEELQLASAGALIGRTHDAACSLRVVFVSTTASFTGEKEGLR